MFSKNVMRSKQVSKTNIIETLKSNKNTFKKASFAWVFSRGTTIIFSFILWLLYGIPALVGY